MIWLTHMGETPGQKAGSGETYAERFNCWYWWQKRVGFNTRRAGSPLLANELNAFRTRVCSPYVVCFAERLLYALLTHV